MAHTILVLRVPAGSGPRICSILMPTWKRCPHTRYYKHSQQQSNSKLSRLTTGVRAIEEGPGRSSMSSNSCETDRWRCQDPSRTGGNAGSRCCRSYMTSSRDRRAGSRRRSGIIASGQVMRRRSLLRFRKSSDMGLSFEKRGIHLANLVTELQPCSI